MELLTQQNIRLYTENRQGDGHRELNRVDHEYLYWNIIVLALKIGRPAVAILVATEASYFYASFRTSTTMFILYELIKYHLETGKVAACLAYYGKFDKANKLSIKKTRV